jgi:UDP-N-acetylmuramate dehydrogenase
MSFKQDKTSRELSQLFSLAKFEEPLCHYSSLRVGGPAWALVEPSTSDELIQAYEFARAKEIPFRVLGAGSSVIPDDRGFRGLIICTHKLDPRPRRLSADVVEASCGVTMPRLAMFCQKRGLSGLEWTIGIPGTLGGGIWMNAGAWGRDISTVALDISFWDGSGVSTVRGEDVRWTYRYSSFQDHTEWVILSARLRLERSTPRAVRQAVKERVRDIRATQPRWHPSVGTVFKANRQALPTLAAGLRVGSMVCCPQNPGWINNLGQGRACDARRLVQLVMWRHLWRGLPMPKIEPIFLPYDPRYGVSPTVRFNHPPLPVRIMARITRRWAFLFQDALTDWRPAPAR